MGNAAIHVVDRGSSISAILWCLWSRGPERTPTPFGPLELLHRRACYGEDGPRHKLRIVEHWQVADAGQDCEDRAG
jgi:hypothetical protein